MPVELDHPAVVAYVARLEEAAGALPPGLRTELVDDIRAHLAEGLADVPADDPLAVQELLDRLGEPADIVAEELREAGLSLTPAGPRVPARPASPSAPQDGGPLPPGGAAAGRWGPLEIAAVVLLTVGNLLLLVGPLLGLVLLWMSPRWTTRQKWAGTGGGLALLLLTVVLVPALFFVSASESVPAPAPGSSASPTVSSAVPPSSSPAGSG